MSVPGVENERETLACLMIDDPLLKPQHGCLDYEKLLEEMKRHNFFTEIGFIPWNYKRSDPKIVRLIAANPEYYALCVHGCNHTAREFAGVDDQKLSALAATALWRMEEHKQLTGLPYDPVFLFPQGYFSTEAIKVVKAQGFSSVVNTTLKATNSEEPSAAEYQKPATLMYHDFPVFLRRYPRDKSYFPHDLASGRPIIIGEHHSAFRNGYKAITDLVDWINGLGKVRWKSLSDITKHYFGDTIALTLPNTCPPPAPLRQRIGIASRRYLCEVRDNYVETSTFLTQIYKTLRG